MAIGPIITSWTEYAALAEQLLGEAAHSIDIFDDDLQALHLDRTGQIDCLSRFLGRSPTTSLRIALRKTDALRRQHPRLLELLGTFAHKFHIREIPSHLNHLADCMMIVDRRSVLVRFHHDHARCREIRDDEEASRPYSKRFDEIWDEGGTPISASTTGL